MAFANDFDAFLDPLTLGGLLYTLLENLKLCSKTQISGKLTKL